MNRPIGRPHLCEHGNMEALKSGEVLGVVNDDNRIFSVPNQYHSLWLPFRMPFVCSATHALHNAVVAPWFAVSGATVRVADPSRHYRGGGIALRAHKE